MKEKRNRRRKRRARDEYRKKRGRKAGAKLFAIFTVICKVFKESVSVSMGRCVLVVVVGVWGRESRN